jgi:hypothetical protein
MIGSALTGVGPVGACPPPSKNLRRRVFEPDTACASRHIAATSSIRDCRERARAGAVILEAVINETR